MEGLICGLRNETCETEEWLEMMMMTTTEQQLVEG